MKKKCKVVMLPTTNEKAPVLFLGNDNKISKEFRRIPSLMHHLYILSDEEIKEGEVLPYLMKWENGYELFNSNNGIRKSKVDRAKRIIATTNKSLGLPEPPPGFPSVFVREYNKGNVIENVMVEYEYNKLYPMVQNNNIQLKIDKNNYITITKVEDSWNREEVINLLYLFGSRMEDRNDIRPYYRYEEWIEENL